MPEPAPDILRVDMQLPQVFADRETSVSLRLSDPKLYAAPIPITSGLVEDAGAVISVGLARIDSGLVGTYAKMRGDREIGAAPGFVTLDEEAVYEGVHIFTRYFFSRPGDRVVVIRAVAVEPAPDATAEIR